MDWAADLNVELMEMLRFQFHHHQYHRHLSLLSMISY